MVQSSEAAAAAAAATHNKIIRIQATEQQRTAVWRVLRFVQLCYARSLECG